MFAALSVADLAGIIGSAGLTASLLAWAETGMPKVCALATWPSGQPAELALGRALSSWENDEQAPSTGTADPGRFLFPGQQRAAEHLIASTNPVAWHAHRDGASVSA